MSQGSSPQLEHMAADANLERAFEWLKESRAEFSDSADIWSYRHHWCDRKSILQHKLLQGHFQFSVLDRVEATDQHLSIYCAEDALVLRAIAQVIDPWLHSAYAPIYHRKTGDRKAGIKSALRAVEATLTTNKQAPVYRFVFRSDIKSFYASIQHDNIHQQLDSLDLDSRIISLIMQSLQRTETLGGEFYDIDQGLPLGSPLSPVLGAIALFPLDQAMAKFQGVFYIRYMDDWIVLCRNRHQLRRVVKATHRSLKQCGNLKLHPDKTYIGPIKKGFDYLGYAFASQQLTTNINTIEKSKTKLLALYEQARKKIRNGKCLKQYIPIADRLAQYWQNFCRWLRAGLPSLTVNINWQEAMTSCREQLPIGIIERLVSIAEKTFR